MTNTAKIYPFLMHLPIFQVAERLHEFFSNRETLRDVTIHDLKQFLFNFEENFVKVCQKDDLPRGSEGAEWGDWYLNVKC